MKKLKFLTLAAIAAATAMVSSCSDNDVLEGVKDTGIPFSVTASTNSGGSRGSDITTLSNFQLWGFGTDQESHFDGHNFTPKAGSTTVFVSSDNTPNWPNTSNCLFYGISNNTSDMLYGVPDDSPGINTTKADIRNGSFDYTIPTNVADQEDLLVAAATGNSNDGVQLKFDHALAAAKLNLVLDPSSTNYADDEGVQYYFYMKVKSITIHNIKISGTYTFDGTHTDDGEEKNANNNYVNGHWNTTSGTVGDYVITPSSPILIQQLVGGVTTLPVNVDGSNGNMYFIPQNVTKWDIAPNKDGQDMTLPDDSKSYIEFEAMSGVYDREGVVDYLQNIVDSKWEKKEVGNEEDGYYSNDTKVADLDGSNPDESNEMISLFASLNLDYTNDQMKSFLDELLGWEKKEVGNEEVDGYYCNGAKVAELDGKVVNFSNAILNFQGYSYPPTMETYTTQMPYSDQLQGNFSDINNDNLYGILYKPLNTTLEVNGNRILKVRMDTGVRPNGSGAYGEGSTTSTGS